MTGPLAPDAAIPLLAQITLKSERFALVPRGRIVPIGLGEFPRDGAAVLEETPALEVVLDEGAARQDWRRGGRGVLGTAPTPADGAPP